MHTPDEIKKGLEWCQLQDGHIYTDCPHCPYYLTSSHCDMKLHADALAYIQQLERERDAIQADFNTYLRRNILKTAGVYACDLCKHGGDYMEIEELTCPDGGCDGMEHWEWRGVKEDSDESHP